MKKLFHCFLLFILLSFVNPVKGQQIIQIDLSDTASHLGLKKKLKTGDWYQIRLKNINLNAYKVDVTTADSFYTFSLKTPSFEDLPTDLISTLASDLVSSIDISVSEDIDKGNTESILKGWNLTPLITTKSNPLSSLKQTALIIEQEIIRFTNSYNTNMLEVASKRNEAIVNGKTGWSLHNLIRTKTEELRTELESLNQMIKLHLLAVNDYKTQNVAAISKDPLKSEIQKLETFNAELVKSQDKLNEVLSVATISPMLLQSRFIDNNETMTYTTMPQRFNGSKATVSVVLTPRDSSYLLNSYSTKFVIEQKKGFYFGTGLSFYVSGLSDESFSTVKETSATDTTYSVVAEDPAEFEVGISSLLRAGLHHQFDNSLELGGHLSFGPGISISEKVRPRILLGAGVSVGSGKHALSIDGGLIMGPVQQKSNSINDGARFSERPERLTVSTPKGSWFFSFGYMLKF